MDPIRSEFLHVFRKPDQTCSKSLQFLKRGIRVLSDREVERGGGGGEVSPSRVQVMHSCGHMLCKLTPLILNKTFIFTFPNKYQIFCEKGPEITSKFGFVLCPSLKKCYSAG